MTNGIQNIIKIGSWFTPEDCIKYLESHKAHYDIPENRKRKNLADRAYQSTKEYKQKTKN